MSSVLCRNRRAFSGHQNGSLHSTQQFALFFYLLSAKTVVKVSSMSSEDTKSDADVAVELFNQFQPYRGVFCRPQSLSVVDCHLFWLQGQPLALFALDLSQPEAEPFNVLEPAARKTAMSKEEELLRQRQRNALQGITSYKVLDRNQIFFQANGSLYFSSKGHAVDVFEKVSLQGPPTDIQHAPHDPFTISFVNNENIHMLKINLAEDGSVAGADHTPITTAGRKDHACGVADYITQEEFERYTGYWWSPDGKKIAYLITDTSMLPEITVIDSKNETEKMRFPKVGDPNATQFLAVVDLESKTFAALNADFEQPVEYIPRVGWTSNQHIYLQLLDRPQERTTIVQIDETKLPKVAEAVLGKDAPLTEIPKYAVKPVVLFKDERPEAWIDVTAPLKKVSDGAMVFVTRNDLKYGGYQHIFNVPVAQNAPTESETFNVTPLTHGKWNVQGNSIEVHQCSGRIYFRAATEEEPLQTAVFYVVRGESGELHRVSPIGIHIESFAVVSTEQVACVVHDGANVPHIQVYSGDKGAHTRSLGVHWFSLAGEAIERCPLPETVSFKNRHGTNLYAHIFLPRSSASAPPKSQPLMMYVYGGPHVQLINRGSFYCRTNPLHNTLLSMGIAVAMVDNRMSEANGQVSHKDCKKAMGTFETEDYVDAVKAICEFEHSIDPTRVGIFGWSYGGYATLLAMGQAPEVFRLGAAGAPVGDWRLYDSGYTERYMGVPTTDPSSAAAYDRSTIAKVAAGFPKELDRLILAHGLADENVHFSHTCHILNAMIEHRKPYRLLAYPGERHGMGRKANEHYNGLLCQAIVDVFRKK